MRDTEGGQGQRDAEQVRGGSVEEHSGPPREPGHHEEDDQSAHPGEGRDDSGQGPRARTNYDYGFRAGRHAS